MVVKKYFILKSHMNNECSSIYSKEIYPVANNPLENKKSCVSEINIRQHHNNEHCGQNSKYFLKDVGAFFIELKICDE